MNLPQPLPSDGQLVDATRRGSDPAWAELQSRHGWAVVAVARAHRLRDARRVAQDVMEHLRRTITEGEPIPDEVAAVRAFRPRAIAELTARRRPSAAVGAPGDDDNGEMVEDRNALARAYTRMPEPWQTVLWHGVIERQPASELTPMLGRGVNDVIALQHIARSGLHRAFLRSIAYRDSSHLAEECRGIVPLLAAAGRGTLAAHDQRIVDAHVAAGRQGAPCHECRARLDPVATIDDRLPAAIVPGITGLSVDRYRAVIGAGDRTFGSAALRASRSNRVRRLAVVGAAAVVALAIIGAFVLIRHPFEVSTSTSNGPIATSAATSGAPSSTIAETTEPPTTTAETAPTTTELPLRPPPSGPANTVELIFGAGTRPLAGSPAPIDLDVEVSSPGRVFAGGTGTIDVAITNNDAVESETNFEIRTARGLRFDTLVDGEAECRGPDEQAAFCNVSVAPGETATVALRFLLDTSAVGRLVVDPVAVGEQLEVGIAATPRLVHDSVGRGDLLMIGNTVISCDDRVPECAGARDLTGAVVNRWDVPLRFIGEFSPFGWRNSSSATLELPADAGVEAAYLFWSGDVDERGQQASRDAADRVSMFAPGSPLPVTVVADQLVLGDLDASQYIAHADVTDIVAASGAGDYLVGNVQAVEVQGAYAGWSLVVVTTADDQPRRQHIVTSPFAWFAPDYLYRAGLPVPFGVDQPGALDVLAFEGEPGFLPERLAVGGVALGGDNEFDGSITGPRNPAHANSFGIDIESYDLSIDAPDGALTFDATSDKDGVRLAVLGLTVDLES